MPTDCRLTVIAKSFIECVNGASNYKIEKKDEKKKSVSRARRHNSIKRLFEEGHKKHISAPLNW